MDSVDPDLLPRRLKKYGDLVRRYHATLDLVSDRALESLDELVAEGVAYAELIADLSPAPRSLLDLGSGAGLPGIPIAAALPDLRVLLVERRRRRVTFLRMAVAGLDLANAEVAAADVREIQGVRVQVVTAQAVATLSEIYRLTCHLHAEDVWLITRRGQIDAAELRDLENSSEAAIAELRESAMGRHGRLVAVRLSGGRACPPSG